jgi:hypothetical protein
MFIKLAGFRLSESRRVVSFGPRRLAAGKRPAVHAQAPHSQAPHCNDNLPGFRSPASRRRRQKPVLICHWVSIAGRLECRWQAEAGDATSAEGVDQRRNFRTIARVGARRRMEAA